MDGHTHITQHPEYAIAIKLSSGDWLGISNQSRPHRRFRNEDEAAAFLGKLTKYDERPDKKKDDGWTATVRFEGVALARIYALSEEAYANDTTTPAFDGSLPKKAKATESTPASSLAAKPTKASRRKKAS